MSTLAVNNAAEKDGDLYHILRHLFGMVQASSMTGRDWTVASTITDIEVCIMTEYEHRCGDRISCQSFGFEDGEYRCHIFTFTQAKKETA